MPCKLGLTVVFHLQGGCGNAALLPPITNPMPGWQGRQSETNRRNIRQHSTHTQGTNTKYVQEENGTEKKKVNKQDQGDLCRSPEF